jgi:hypothetical protein
LAFSDSWSVRSDLTSGVWSWTPVLAAAAGNRGAADTCGAAALVKTLGCCGAGAAATTFGGGGGGETYGTGADLGTGAVRHSRASILPCRSRMAPGTGSMTM